ncbi:MAG: hypothetical protein HY554_07555 [Elusimicrobia bacterium]|nr:hypothetical protein [Elusimicrobiota bacterium]
MNLLNRYFAPFAALLIVSAVYFTEPDRRTLVLSGGVFVASLLVNWWLSANTYRFVGWAGRLRTVQIWLNFVWAVPLFYLLGGFWGPMWLLFVMAPVTAALYGGWAQTLSTALVSAGTMLGLYWLRGLEGEVAWGMAGIHAAFIVIMALFTYSLAQTALRLRDLNR